MMRLPLMITLLAALSLAPRAEAQEEGRTILATLASNLAQMGTYEIDFSLEAEGMGASKGRCGIGDRGRYWIEVEDMRQSSDGSSVWVVNPATREVTIDNLNPHSRSLFDNPTRAFEFSEELFAVDSVSHEAAVVHLYLVPAAGVLEGVERIHLVVEADDAMPLSLSYEIGGAELHIIIHSIVPYTPAEADFVPTVADDYEVIDFR